MKKYLPALFLSVSCFLATASQQTHPGDELPADPFASVFEKAYQLHPSIPKGVLEAVAYTNSRFHHITHNPGDAESCIGLPKYFGVMGLVADGKNYFQNNLTVVANLSHFTPDEIISSPEKNILAYAEAYEQAQKNLLADSKIENQVPVLVFMSELPDNGSPGNNYAMSAHLYSVLSFLNDRKCSVKYDFPEYDIDLAAIFGEENLKVLSASFITMSPGEISDKNGNVFKGSTLPVVQSADYPPAAWVASPNYSSRGVAVSAVTIHTVQGSYAGCISWFQNTSSGVSAHYVVKSSTGAITQMVLESNKGWHVGSENPYTIGIEHEGYVNDASWYTTAMYTESAALVKDMCNSGYGINPKRTGFWPWLASTYYNQAGIPGNCSTIKGHMHYPNQTHTDPGPNWNWDYYYKLINDPAPAPTVFTASAGNFYDSGGAGGNYTDDERLVWTISPAGATSVTLTFSSFDTENTWDYLYVYNGTDVWAPLIGYYTGTSNPGTLVANSGSITLEFRSDCLTNAAGWNASWTSNATTVTPTNLAVTGLGCPSLGVNLSWQNSGANWYIDVSDDAGYTYYWNKAVSNITTIGCPGGFALNSNPGSFLAFQPSTVYYWRIWDGTSHTNGSPFTTPNCLYMDTTCSGTFDDTGGPSAAYAGNEDWTNIIQPGFASSVTMTFTGFDLETDFDSLWVYDSLPGTNLIGVYTGTVSPGTVTANSGIMSVRFKSDPFVNNAGWTAAWNCVSTTGTDEANSGVEVNVYPNPFSVTTTLRIIPKGLASATDGNEVRMKDLRLELFDLVGKKIDQLIICNSEEFVIHRKDLPAGIYLYKLKGGDDPDSYREIHTGKLIVE